MSLRNAMKAIAEIEASIELPQSVIEDMNLTAFTKVRKAFMLPPAKGVGGFEPPCFINWPDSATEQRMGDFREDALTVQVDFYGPNVDIGPELALAYFDAAWAAFDAERPYGRRLNGSVDFLEPRGERPMVATLEWNGLPYPGFRIYLDLVLFNEVAQL